MAVDHHRAGIRTQPIDALPANPVRLPHFLNAHQITVVTNAVHADRNVEVKLMLPFIRLFPAQIPFNACTAQHWPGEAELQRTFWGYGSDADQTLFPNPVIGE